MMVLRTPRAASCLGAVGLEDDGGDDAVVLEPVGEVVGDDDDERWSDDIGWIEV